MVLLSYRIRRIAAMVAMVTCAGAADGASLRATVAAGIADDIRALVVRDPSNRVTTYFVGQVVEGTSWRVSAVHRGEAILRSTQPYKNAPLEVRVRLGQPIPEGAPAGPNAAAVNSQDNGRSQD
jgi:hypothetical protein